LAIIRNVSWNESETKKINSWFPKSTELMEHLEVKLFQSGLIEGCSETPFYNKKTGFLAYYRKGGRKLLTSAPRKKDGYIHVEVWHSNLSPSILKGKGIKTGNINDSSHFDVMLYEKDEIEILVSLLENNLDIQGQQNEIKELPTSLTNWVEEFYEDTYFQERSAEIERLRKDFLGTFPGLLEKLQSDEITLLEFKKNIDQLTKVKHEVKGEKINLWGFSGFSGQMFFNQLCNQAEFVNMIDPLKQAFLEAIHIASPEESDFKWTKEKYRSFARIINETKKVAIENGYAPTKCANIKFSTFFLSFFWGIQNLSKYPLYYEVSRKALTYLGYDFQMEETDFDTAKYMRFAEKCYQLSEDIKNFSGKSMDMEVLAQFFSYVIYRIKESESVNEIDFDPINEDAFAAKLQDTLNDLGYIVTNMSTEDEAHPELPDEFSEKIIWKFQCKKGRELISFHFVWENENDQHCYLYVESEEGSLQTQGVINTEDDENQFLIELKELLRKINMEKRSYTILDAANETFVNKETLEEWLELLSEQRQIILYGPPGTGKTFVANRLAKILTQSESQVELIQFHPSYTYEEFIEGIRPELIKGENGISHMNVSVKPGLFTKLCKEARKQENQQKSYVLIIDEINRANTAKVFGELLYALEYRNTAIPLPYSNSNLVIPENVYLIGTMNTTDRSLSQLDFALRRRFQFLPFSTHETAHVLRNYLQKYQPEMIWVSDLVQLVNLKINNPDISIGHSYFIGHNLSMERLQRIWKYQIMPYLEECFVYQPETLSEFGLETLIGELNYANT
jgi:5-methylcytosine-specific restriction enzyme B